MESHFTNMTNPKKKAGAKPALNADRRQNCTRLAPPIPKKAFSLSDPKKDHTARRPKKVSAPPLPRKVFTMPRPKQVFAMARPKKDLLPPRPRKVKSRCDFKMVVTWRAPS